MRHKCEVAFEVTRPSNSMGFPIASRIVVVSTSFDFSHLMPTHAPFFYKETPPPLGPDVVGYHDFARHIKKASLLKLFLFNKH